MKYQEKKIFHEHRNLEHETTQDRDPAEFGALNSKGGVNRPKLQGIIPGMGSDCCPLHGEGLSKQL